MHATLRSLLPGVFTLLTGCGDATSDSAASTSSTMPGTSAPGSSDEVGSAPTTSGHDGTVGAPGTTTTTTTSSSSSSTSDPATTDDTGALKLDVGGMPDVGGGDPGELPANCTEAQQFETTIGCTFYALDLDNYSPWDTSQWGVAVANVQADVVASVIVEVKTGGEWQTVAGPEAIAAQDLHVFALPDRHQEGSGVQVGGAYRVTSDVPVIAYQFDPLGDMNDVGWASADASLLHPSPSWDTINSVVGIGSTGYMLPPQGAYATVVAAHDGTVVTVVPGTATLAGPGVPAGVPGQPFEVQLDEGDVVEVMTKTPGASLTGTRISSNDGHPVGVFSGHECANIPADVYACDHLEEQMPGVRRWGTRFVAARVPVRVGPGDPPEPSLWQIHASEDDTEVTLTASPAITGLPPSPFTLDAGEVAEFMVGGAPGDPGDFLVDATRPIAVANYMTSQDNISLPGKTGDPAMLLLSPVEQYLSGYVVLVPTAWPNDTATFIRHAGATVTIDDVPVPEDAWYPVGPDHEVARTVVPDGVHRLKGDQPFSVTITGTHQTGSYAYLGGMATVKINPNPQ